MSPAAGPESLQWDAIAFNTSGNARRRTRGVHAGPWTEAFRQRALPPPSDEDPRIAQIRSSADARPWRLVTIRIGGGSHPSLPESRLRGLRQPATDRQSSGVSRSLRSTVGHGFPRAPDAIASGRRGTDIPRRDRTGQPLESSAATTFAQRQTPAPGATSAAGTAEAGDGGVTSVAREDAPPTRPLHQRLFGNLFSRDRLSGDEPTQPDATEPPTPPQRGAQMLNGAQPLTPHGDARYTSFR